MLYQAEFGGAFSFSAPPESCILHHGRRKTRHAPRGECFLEDKMFVYSVRASTVKFFAVIALALVALVIALSFGGGDAVYASLDGLEINYGGMKTAEDRLDFIRGFGLQVSETPVTEESFSVPESFDRVIAGYNEIQKRQGLDLTKYAKKRVTHYAYEVTNWADEGKVYVNLIIHRNRVIACDVSSAEAGGFILPLTEIDSAKLKK